MKGKGKIMTVDEIRREVFSNDHGFFSAMSYQHVRKIFTALEKQLAECDPDICAKTSGTKWMAKSFVEILPFAQHKEGCVSSGGCGKCTCGLERITGAVRNRLGYAAKRPLGRVEPTTVIGLLDWALSACGLDGLCAEDGRCGCEIGSLEPCGELPADCQPARKGPCKAPDGGYCPDGGLDGNCDWHMYPATAQKG